MAASSLNVSPRRYDPTRRDRLIDTALEVIAERGVAGTSHRRIAAAADVPLGSMSYHFSGMEDLLIEAFTRHAEHVAAKFEARMDGAADIAEAREALVELITQDLVGEPRDQVLAYELYAAAIRIPALRRVTQAWMQRSREALQRHFSEESARLLDALVEGLALHGTLSTEPLAEDEIREAIRRIGN
jgi:DNA-binding transcriptional regulator YbjK